MKKWVILLLSLLLIVLLLMISSPFNIFKASMTRQETGERAKILFIQNETKEEQIEPPLISVLKRLREKLDEWLKSINDRIESEDASRLEVRFLEVLRSMLGWVREKVDAKIASFEKGKLKETHQTLFSFFKVG